MTEPRTARTEASGVRSSDCRSISLDLIQLHGVCDAEDLDRAMGRGGAIEGAVRAKDKRRVDAIGITGHGMQAPAVHLEALRRSVKTVITPYNYALSRYPDYLRDFEALVHEVKTHDAGLMLIKAAARNLWKTGEPPPTHDVVRASRRAGAARRGDRLRVGPTARPGSARRVTSNCCSWSSRRSNARERCR